LIVVLVPAALGGRTCFLQDQVLCFEDFTGDSVVLLDAPMYRRSHRLCTRKILGQKSPERRRSPKNQYSSQTMGKGRINLENPKKGSRWDRFVID
jgi:hypothetical protein